MNSPPVFCTVTKRLKGNILAPYHCHRLVTNTKPETLTKTKYLQDSSDHDPESYNPYKTSFFSIPTAIATSLLDSPNQSTVLCNADKTSAATLQQLAEEESFIILIFQAWSPILVEHSCHYQHHCTLICKPQRPLQT